jgi:hypothetical protein
MLSAPIARTLDDLPPEPCLATPIVDGGVAPPRAAQSPMRSVAFFYILRWTLSSAQNVVFARQSAMIGMTNLHRQ